MVVLIEPNPDEETILLRALRSCGVESVRVARGAEEAAWMLISGEERLPRLVLLDLEATDRGALELIVELRSDPACALLPLVCLTDSLSPCLAQEAYLAGATSVVLKPVDCEGLLRVLGALCEFWLRVSSATYDETRQVGGASVPLSLRGRRS